MNYRLDLTIELDTASKPQAERWEREVLAALDGCVPVSGVLSDLSMVDEYGDTVPEDES